MKTQQTDAICTRCQGKGKLAKYAHIDDGVCYKCHGQGYYSPREDAENRAYAAEKANFIFEINALIETKSKEISELRMSTYATITGWTRDEIQADYDARCYAHDLAHGEKELKEIVTFQGVRGTLVDGKFGPSLVFKTPQGLKYCGLSSAKDFSKRREYYVAKGFEYVVWVDVIPVDNKGYPPYFTRHLEALQDACKEAYKELSDLEALLD